MPEESLRMMLVDEAMNDYRALDCLAGLIGRERVLEMIDEDLETPLTFDSFPDWPDDARYLLQLRRKVNRAICEADGAA